MFRDSRTSMPEWFISPKLELRASPIHGVGVFATAKIETHELIESSPIILFHSDTMETLHEMTDTRHILMDYPFSWRDGMSAIAHGFGGLYNHSTINPNATFRNNYDLPSIEFYSRCVIKPGDEVLVRYISMQDMERLWFVDPDAPDVSVAPHTAPPPGFALGDINNWDIDD